MITHEMWGQRRNCTLFTYDNTANGNADRSMLNPKKKGDLRLEIKFGAANGYTITSLSGASLKTY